MAICVSDDNHNYLGYGREGKDQGWYNHMSSLHKYLGTFLMKFTHDRFHTFLRKEEKLAGPDSPSAHTPTYTYTCSL